MKFEDPLRLALTDADMTKEEIDKIVIVGGSTRAPWIKKWLKEYFETDVLYETINADEGVAYGATMMAGLLEGQVLQNEEEEIFNPQDQPGASANCIPETPSLNVVVSDVSPQTLGIAAYVYLG